MSNLYQAAEHARYRQAELLDEAARDRLARSAREGRQPSVSDRVPAARRVALLVTIALSVIGAVDVVGRLVR